MAVAPMNLIATAVPVLNTLGLRVRVGLSSDDPIVHRRQPPQAYRAHAAFYRPDGRLLERLDLGVIPPRRRRMIDVSELAGRYGLTEDHLVTVHRMPEPSAAPRSGWRLLGDRVRAYDYSFYRTYIEYAWRDRPSGNGSVVYEIPPAMNERREGQRPSTTLSFTTKIWLSERARTYVALINCSTDPGYALTSTYGYGFHAPDGSTVAAGRVQIPPFGVRVLDAHALIPADERRRLTDPADGAAICSFVGYCLGAGTVVVVLNLDRDGGGVSVEHTHPAQAYLMPGSLENPARLSARIKAEAAAAWHARLSAEEVAA